MAHRDEIVNRIVRHFARNSCAKNIDVETAKEPSWKKKVQQHGAVMDNLMQNIVDIAKEHRLDVSAAMDYALSSSVSYTMIVIREHDGSVSKLTIATPHVSRFVMDFRSNIEAKKAA